MTLSPMQNILGVYLSVRTKEVFRRLFIMEYPEYSEKQLNDITERLGHLTTPCHDVQILLVFTEIVKDMQQFHADKTLDEKIDIVWEKEYEKTFVSREDLKQMYTNWLLLEKQWEELEKQNLIEFTQENRQLLETLINKEHSNDLEHER